MSRDVFFFNEGGVYGHKKDHVEKWKSGLNGDFNHENALNVPVPNVTNPTSIPSFSSPNSISSPTLKVRSLNDIYHKILAHE